MTPANTASASATTPGHRPDPRGRQPAPGRVVPADHGAQRHGHRRPEHTLGLAESALSLADGRAGPGLSPCSSSAARGRSPSPGAGRRVAEVRRAQDLMLRGEGEGEELPYWVALSGAPAPPSPATPRTFPKPERPRQRREVLRGVGARLWQARRRQVQDHRPVAGLAGPQQAAQGHLEQACSTWDRALALFDGVYSERVVKEVGGIGGSSPRSRVGASPRRPSWTRAPAPGSSSTPETAGDGGLRCQRAPLRWRSCAPRSGSNAVRSALPPLRSTQRSAA